MQAFHDPIRQLNYIQQSLTHDKKPLGLFLSAGCGLAVRIKNGSADLPLIPDIVGLTEALADKLPVGSDARRVFDGISKQLKDDGLAAPNLEDILGHIRSLKLVAGGEKVRGFSAGELGDSDDLICKAIFELVNKTLPDKTTPHHSVASWIGAIPRSDPVSLFTTNYDLLFEQALEEIRVPYFDGFVGSRQTFFDPHAIEQDKLPPRWARLWKLHGSINWWQDKNGTIFRGGLEESNGQRRIIHPSHLKYDESRRMPYLAMTDQLKAFLRQPFSVLVSCGYSFRDIHINATLMEGLQGNPSATLFGIVHGELNRYSKATSEAICRANFNLLAVDQAIIGTKCLPWQEKAHSDAIIEHTGIDWEPKDPADTSSSKVAKFNLGDFVRFGDLLREITGMTRTPESEKNVR